jgi:hypothetical protein
MSEAVDPGLMGPHSKAEKALQQHLQVRTGTLSLLLSPFLVLLYVSEYTF